MSLKEADNDNEVTEDMINHTHTNEANSETRLRDIIQTCTLEIVKGPEDIERLLENGALATLEEIQDITKQADTVLPQGGIIGAYGEWDQAKGQKIFVAVNHTQ